MNNSHYLRFLLQCTLAIWIVLLPLTRADGDRAWEIMPDIGVGAIFDVSFVDEKRAWLAAGDCLLRTNDGGVRWHTIQLPYPPNGGRLRSVEMRQRDDGTCFGWATTMEGQIYHTKNAREWTLQLAPTADSCQPSTLAILDENYAWVTGCGRTLRTIDGGKTWLDNRQESKFQKEAFAGLHLTDVFHFTDRRNGIAIGSLSGYGGMSCLSTSDGGKTWTKSPKQISARPPFRIISSGNAVQCWSNSGNIIYQHGTIPIDDADVLRLLNRKTLPGGYPIVKRFTHQYHVVSKRYIAALEQMQGYSTTTLYITDDAGKNWNRSYLSTGLESLHFFDRNLGWAVGTGGRVSRTRNGGDTWEHRFLPTEADFLDVSFVDEKQGWLGGGTATHGIPYASQQSSGCIWKTVDGGETWHQVSCVDNWRNAENIYPETVVAVIFKSPQTGWAVTNGATQQSIDGSREYARILITQDGGSKWDQVFAPKKGSKVLLSEIDLEGNYLCASGYTCVVTSSDGIRWKHNDRVNSMQALSFAGRGNVIVAGLKGALRRSNDNGATWAQPNLVGEGIANFHGMTFGNPSVGWLASSSEVDGTHDGLFVTTDGGLTWKKSRINWPQSFDEVSRRYMRWQDVFAVDDQHAWALGGSYGTSTLARLVIEK